MLIIHHKFLVQCHNKSKIPDTITLHKNIKNLQNLMQLARINRIILIRLTIRYANQDWTKTYYTPQGTKQ